MPSQGQTSDNTWISSKFSTFHWVCLLFILLILVGVELPLCIAVAILECYKSVFWSQVEYKIALFYFTALITAISNLNSNC